MHAKCPEAEKRQEKREERERLKGDTKTKLYSDSTLRSADVLGLTADILCMSGGGIGQVIQAVIDDPDDCEQVAIFGGANDKKVENFPDTEEYAHNIDLAVTKLGQFARENEHKQFYVVNQVPLNKAPTVDADPVIRHLYLAKRMAQLAANNKNIAMLQIEYEVDETGHPTEAGTYAILKRLHDLQISKTALIWDDQYIVTDRFYSKVQSIYRYGCAGCKRFGAELNNSTHANQLLCDECFAIPPTETRNALLQMIAKKVNDNAVEDEEEDNRDAKRVKFGEGDAQ